MRWARLLSSVVCVWAASPLAADRIAYRTPAGEVAIEGNVLGADRSGTLIVEARDTQIHVVNQSALINWERSTEPVEPYTKAELRDAIRKEFGSSFQILMTNHYLIVYNCAPEYAKDAGELLEKAYKVFTNYFSRRGGYQLVEPRLPLVAIIFRSKEDYVRHVSAMIGDFAQGTAGIYAPRSNRMVMFNAFGGRTGDVLANAIRKGSPNARGATMELVEQNISTVVHEAIHQVAFNTGFHNRLMIDRLPLWLVEGMAMYFEAPDLSAKGGWKGVGTVNRERISTFERIFPNLRPGFFANLIANDESFRDPRVAVEQYSVAWAVTQYLIRMKFKEYLHYLKLVNERNPAEEYTPEQRLEDFRTAFGQDINKLEQDFRKYVPRLGER